jgi:hypothetical protein
MVIYQFSKGTCRECNDKKRRRDEGKTPEEILYEKKKGKSEILFGFDANSTEQYVDSFGRAWYSCKFCKLIKSEDEMYLYENASGECLGCHKENESKKKKTSQYRNYKSKW